MGCLQSSKQSEIEAYIEARMNEERLNTNCLRIVLFGAHNAGKTTVLKQLRIIKQTKIISIAEVDKLIHGYIKNYIENTFSEQYIIPTSIINLCITFYNIYSDDNLSMKSTLCHHSQQIKETIVNNMREICIISMREGIPLHNDKIIKSRDFMVNMENIFDITPSVIDHIKTVWNDENIKQMVLCAPGEMYGVFNHANIEYFFQNDKLDDIMQNEYLPSFEDYVKTKTRSYGYVEERFINQWRGNEQRIYVGDVCGLRYERRKAMHCVTGNDIDCIMYVVPLTDYGSKLFEDGTSYRLHESVEIFQVLMNRGIINDKYILLLFTKYDLLLKQLKNDKIPTINEYFENFPPDMDPNNPDHVCQFIYSLFMDIWKNGNGNENAMPKYKTICSINISEVDNMFNELCAELNNIKDLRSDVTD